MKKTLLFLFSLPVLMNAQTVLFEDDFESPYSLAEDGYTMYNDANIPSGSYASIFTDAWAKVNWSDEEMNIVASCPSWFTTPAAADRWLITPAITIPDDAMNVTLTFKARSHDAPTWADGFSLKISNTSLAKESFDTELLNVEHAVYAPMAIQEPYSVSIPAEYAGQTIYLAWVNTYFNGNLLSIDDISVVYTPNLAVSESGKNSMVIYPNPVSDNFRVKTSGASENVKITVSDASGKIVKTFASMQGQYDISELKAGVYFITVETSSKKETSKIIKK